jgi:oxygen-dependent protoporphyrinogen oxidase
MNPLAFAASPLLTASGKLRLLAEPFVGRGDGGGESVAEFIGRRLGPEVVERLVGPFLIGVYAGDERRLGAEAVFPSLVEMERESGSILRGALGRMLRPRGERGLRGTYSSPDGLGGLAAHMARELGDALQLGTRVTSIRHEAGSWTLGLESRGAAREIRTHALVLATDAASAAVLLRDIDAEAASALDSIEYAPVASVPLAIDPSDARHPIQGFGFLVPRAAGLDLLGALFMSQMFPRRAPEGLELVTGMIGGARWPAVVDAADGKISSGSIAAWIRSVSRRAGDPGGGRCPARPSPRAPGSRSPSAPGAPSWARSRGRLPGGRQRGGYARLGRAGGGRDRPALTATWRAREPGGPPPSPSAAPS